MSAATIIVFTSLGVLVAVFAALRRASLGSRAQILFGVGAVLWLGVMAAVSQLPQFSRNDLLPPPFAFLFMAVTVAGVGLGMSPLGTALAKAVPLRWLMAFHCYRALAELAIYIAFLEGIAPEQMTFLGNNKDVTTAIAAVVLAFVPGLARSRAAIYGFSLLGIGNLLVIVVTAALSMPSPFRYYLNEPSQVWVTQFPYIYLPAVLVVCAFAGHVVILRAIPRQLSRSSNPPL